MFRFSLLFLCILLCMACSIRYDAYIRNPSSHPAIVHVYLLNRQSMYRLPNRVKVADTAVVFQSGYKETYFQRMENINWIDTVHITITVQPNTTIDLSDMLGFIVNGHPRENIRLIVETTAKTDTLLNGRESYSYIGAEKKFKHTKTGISSPVWYYDIE